MRWRSAWPLASTATVTTAREAAQKLGQKLRWIYGHRAQLPVVELPGRGLRFSERGIERLIKKRTTK